MSWVIKGRENEVVREFRLERKTKGGAKKAKDQNAFQFFIYCTGFSSALS